MRRGERSGCCVIVAVHSTALGPALGGVRLWHYPATADAIADALRLASGNDDEGGRRGARPRRRQGRHPCCRPRGRPSGDERAAMLLDFGDLVESLDGRYITAEDVGISPRDMVEIGTRTRHLTGLPADRGGSGDPSPFTAIGVEAAMRACARDRFGAPELEGCGSASSASATSAPASRRLPAGRGSRRRRRPTSRPASARSPSASASTGSSPATR